MVANLLELIPSETVRLNPDRLEHLYVQLGDVAAEDMLGRAVEELAVRLAQCRALWLGQHWQDLRRMVRSLAAISDQIGMTSLVRVAGDVTLAIDAGDDPALGATLFRMVRIGERSLTAVWDVRDLSL